MPAPAEFLSIAVAQDDEVLFCNYIKTFRPFSLTPM
jgi:hypothetical protein